MAKLACQTKSHNFNRLTIKIHQLEKDFLLIEPLAQEKQQLWSNIINLVNDIWPYIHIIFEQNDLVKEASEEIHKSKSQH